jgi:hypothetical protein
MKHLTEVELVMALDGELEPNELQRAVEHLAECDECRGQWEKLQATSAMVVEYQQSLYPAIEKPFAAEERRLTLIKNKSWFGEWQWRLAAAAVLLLTVGVGWYGNGRDSHRSAKSGPQTGAPSVGVEQRNARSFVAKNAPQDDSKVDNVNTPAKKSRKLQKPSSTGKRDLAMNQYTELPFSDAALPLNDATVVRVSLPASALRQAGVAVSEDNATAMLQADVVLGLDGLPRGIRLVKNPVANQAGTN